MELRQLHYLVTVVEEANFTRAAHRLHVAQPGVSAQLRNLERELGHELLDRSGRSVRPTDVGAAVLPFARAALAAVDNVRLTVQEMAGLVRGHVAVGMVTSHNVDLPGLLADFHDAHPAVEITLAEHDSDRLVAQLLAGTLDTAIIAVGPNPPAGLELLGVTDDDIAAAVHPAHPLAGRDSIPLGELREHRLTCLPEGTGIRAHLAAGCALAGFVPHIAFEAGTPGMLAQLAARGLGVAILPGSLARAYPGLHAIALTDPPLRGGLALAWRADGPLSPAAAALIAQARQGLRRNEITGRP